MDWSSGAEKRRQHVFFYWQKSQVGKRLLACGKMRKGQAPFSASCGVLVCMKGGGALESCGHFALWELHPGGVMHGRTTFLCHPTGCLVVLSLCGEFNPAWGVHQLIAKVVR